MRLASFLVPLFLLAPLLMSAAETPPPLTPAEAAKRVNEKVVMQMEVKSTGGDNNRYLNSEEDYKDAKNFTIFISKNDLLKFKNAGIEKPEVHFKGKLIEVTGTVVLQKEKAQIKVEEPDQIKIVTKDKN
jgi:DNA/RNA endonuclease YhcR with UshA esterase domain